MARKAGRRRKKIERFLQKEFKKTGNQAKKQPLNYSFMYDKTPKVNEAETHDTPLNPL